MKKILLTVVLLNACVFGDVKWAKSYQSALDQAQKDQKNVMVMLSKEECPACQYMENVVFEEKVVQDTINRDFIPVHIDIINDAVPTHLRYIGTPTFYFLNSQGKRLERYDGGANIPTFLGVLGKIKKP